MAKAKLDQHTSEEKAHATFGASSSERWLNCPGSIALSEKAPPPPESKYAKEGTDAHACLEFLLRNFAGLVAARKEARKRWPAEMVDHAEDAVHYILSRYDELDGAELLIETRVDASPFTMSGQFGTLDVALVEDFGRLIVMDYKYGAGHAVDPYHREKGRANSQLAYYGLALSHQYNHWFDSVELVVIQPRAFHEAGPIRSYEMSLDELRSWHQVFRDAVMETGDPRAPLRAGDWCRWCPAAVICPKLKGDALKDAQVVFRDDVGVQAVPEPRLIKLPNLGTILDGCDRLEQWIKAVRAHAYGVLEQGGSVPGWKLVERRATRKWRDPAITAHALTRAKVQGAYSEPELLSPAQVEKALKRCGWTKKQMTDFLEGFTVRESSGKTLVRESDKRNAVPGGAADVFDVIPD